MSKGTVTGADAAVVEGPSIMEAPSSQDRDAHLDVCPKECQDSEQLPAVQEDVARDVGQGEGPTGKWWKSSSAAAGSGPPLPTSSLSGSHLTRWSGA